MDAVYSTSNPLHLSALLKAVRTTYNIFLLSRNNDNQNVAQVTMTQMVDHIFRRVKSNPNQIIAVQETAAVVNATTQNEEGDLEKMEEKNGEKEVEADEFGEDVAAKTENGEEGEENNTNAPRPTIAPPETEADSTTYQQQIIVEANMARTEMDHKLPSGKSKDNYEDFLNDTANVFQEPSSTSAANGNASSNQQVHDTT